MTIKFGLFKILFGVPRGSETLGGTLKEVPVTGGWYYTPQGHFRLRGSGMGPRTKVSAKTVLANRPDESGSSTQTQTSTLSVRSWVPVLIYLIYKARGNRRTRVRPSDQTKEKVCVCDRTM